MFIQYGRIHEYHKPIEQKSSIMLRPEERIMERRRHFFFPKTASFVQFCIIYIATSILFDLMDRTKESNFVEGLASASQDRLDES
jgi:hypothetical protein